MEEQGISPLASPLHPPATWHVPGLGLFSPRPGQLPSNQVHGQIRQRIWRQPRPLLGIPNPTGRGRKDESQVFTFPGWLWPRFTLPVLLESGGSEPSQQVGVGSCFPGPKSGWGPANPCRWTAEGSPRKLGGSRSQPWPPRQLQAQGPVVKAAQLSLLDLGSMGALDHPLPVAVSYPQPKPPADHFSRPGQTSKGKKEAEAVWRNQLNF